MRLWGVFVWLPKERAGAFDADKTDLRGPGNRGHCAAVGMVFWLFQ